MRFVRIVLLHCLPAFCGAMGVFFAGCAAPAPVAKEAGIPPAHLAVRNLTDYRWRVTIVDQHAARVAADFEMPARSSHAVELATGDYTIRQTVLSEGAAAELSREIPMKFEAGQEYRWRLATLLSEPEDTTPAAKSP